jgi:hypothetical protein
MQGHGLCPKSIGRKVFSNGKRIEFSKPGESVTFRYRVVIHSGISLNADMNKLFAILKTK